MNSKIKQMGGFLSGIIMPIIGAFIAWGLITALFIPDGWLPNESFATLVDPMLIYLLPILIGYSGGKLIYKDKGGLVGAIATMGVIVSADIPMFLGAMIMGPVGGISIKKFDELLDGRVKSGFEMLINNYAVGIIGAILAVLGILIVGPVVTFLTELFGLIVSFLIDHNLLFLTSLIIEPAKVLFLNNAINHGVLTPLGSIDVQATGQSILFLLEANPGPGVGILLAFAFFGKGSAKSTAPGAIVIQFFGGIHEIYFPYILMKPKMIIAAIFGSMSGIIVFSLLGAGLIAPASPGSIFAIISMAPKGGLFPVLAGVFVSALVSFLIGSLILKSTREVDEIDQAVNKMNEIKGKESKVTSNLSEKKNKKIVFACDAGMGSSAMGSALLKKLAKDNDQSDLDISNRALKDLDNNVDLVITQKSFNEVAKKYAPKSQIYLVDNFLDKKQYENLLESLKK